MLTDRNMVSSERLDPATDSDRYTPRAKQWLELENSYGRLRGKTACPKQNKYSTGRPTGPAYLNTCTSQNWNHQPKNIHRLDPGFPSHMQQMCSLVFMWVMKNWSRALSQKLRPVCGICSTNWAALSVLCERARA